MKKTRSTPLFLTGLLLFIVCHAASKSQCPPQSEGHELEPRIPTRCAPEIVDGAGD